MQPLKVSHRASRPIYVVSWLLLTANVGAQIVTDGSVGPVQDLGGPDFSIPESLGSRAGGNLFHSFQHFNILTGQSATFSGASEIANVISRVTGGERSTIDGILRSTVGQADFYFLNPAGILFDANAQVDVPGSFYVSTANQLRFADGAVYDTKNPAASTLSFDQPASFGFLGDQTATISVVGSNLELTPGKTLSFTAGELEIENAQLLVDRGNIQLVAIGDAANTLAIEGDPSEPAEGKLNISASRINASGDGTGRIAIRGGSSQIGSSFILALNSGSVPADAEKGIDIHADSLDVETSIIATNTFGQGQGGNISLIVEEDLSIVNGGAVISNSLAGGHAGQISVTASSLTVDGQGSNLFTGILSNAQPGSSGNAGAVTVTVDDSASIVNGSEVSSGTLSTGHAGPVSFKARTLTVDRQNSESFFTGIASQAGRGSSGSAGSVTVSIDDVLSITNGGAVSSSTFSEGNAGPVSLTADTLMIDGQGRNAFTGIASNANPGSSGDAGIITVNVFNDMSIVDGGQVSSGTLNTGDAGQINLTADTLTIDRQGSKLVTGIITQTGGSSSGKAGNVAINVTDGVSIVKGGVVASSSFGTGDAGGVTMTAGTLTIDGQGSDHATGIASESGGKLSGKAGTVSVSVDDTLTVVNGSIISSSTSGVGNGGQVYVRAGALTVDGQGGKLVTGIASQASRGSKGNAGTVTVDVNGAVWLLNGGGIDSSTFSTGDAGSVSVKAESLTVDRQGSNFVTGITSQADRNSSGAAGTVTVNVDGPLSIVNGGVLSSSTLGEGDAGEVSVRSSTLAIDGQGSDLNTGIVSIADSGSLGQAGNIKLDTQNLSIVNGGTISIESDPTINAATLTTIKPTEINISAQNVTLRDSSITTESIGNVPAGSITLNVADTLSLDPSRISTAANNADGGDISIQAKVIDLQDSQITTSVRGQGDGGDIDLTAKVLVLDSGFIQANTAGANARGGDIRINTDALVASQNLLITGGSTPLSFQPGLNIIQAAAPDGVSGSINITSPQLDISGDLTDLEAELLDIDKVAQGPCATPGGRQSRLAKLGRGGLPESPEQAGSVVIDSDRLQRLLPKAEPTRHPPSVSAQPFTGPQSTLTIAPLWLSAHAETDC